MSDYLWDKTGEPEEDVAQLEQLLGALKYKPRPLEIPASAMPTTAAAAAERTRPAAIFSRPRLALAASLVLTLLAGAWLVTRQDEPQKNRIAEVERGNQTGGGSQPDTPFVANAGTETEKNAATADFEQTKPREQAKPHEQAKRREDLKSRERGTASVASFKPQRASRRLTARRHKLTPRVEDDDVPAPRELVAGGGAMRWQVEEPLTPQQREATEQLMFALRLASAKLNYAQREMQEIGRAGK